MAASLGSVVAVLICASFGVFADEFPVKSEVGSYDPEFGVFLGELPNLADGDVSGKVYIINDTALQILNFTYNGKAPDLYFWLDYETSPSTNGTKIPSFEYGITPLGEYDNQERVLLLLPGQHKLSSYGSFSLFCYKYEHNFSSLPISKNLTIPKSQFLNNGAAELKGSRYSVGSGPILVVDRRTIKVYAFTFDGDKAPGPNFAHDAGVKVPIRGRDTPELITAMNERYRGGEDIFLTLPDDYDIEHIDWISIYCYKFRVDFGHVTVSNISQRIPPYVPPPKKLEDSELSKVEVWPTTSLLGTDLRRNFTFQLGLPGGKKGYQGMARARPPKYVWYVNGYLAPELYLRRGIEYRFIVEGGDDRSTSDFFNPLYVSDSPYGGYAKMSDDERKQVHVYAGFDAAPTAGRLCVWSSDEAEANADSFASFAEFRRTLSLKCEQGQRPGELLFTSDRNTPDTLYYQSYSFYNMGWKIHIVNELPPLPDWTEDPYRYEEWRKHQQMDGGALRASSPASEAPLLSLLSTGLLFFAARLMV